MDDFKLDGLITATFTPMKANGWWLHACMLFCCRSVSFESPTATWGVSVTDDDDDVELNVLGCRVDMLGTNCDQCVCRVQCCFTSTETVTNACAWFSAAVRPQKLWPMRKHGSLLLYVHRNCDQGVSMVHCCFTSTETVTNALAWFCVALRPQKLRPMRKHGSVLLYVHRNCDQSV